MYKRDAFQEGFYTSQNPGPPLGLLSPYTADTRRNSDVSAFSLSSFNTYASDYSVPPTPVCGRSPFSAESFGPIAMELTHGQSGQLLPIVEYQMKNVVFDDSLHESWTLTNTSIQMDQVVALQTNEEVPLHGNFLSPQAMSYMGLNTAATDSSSSSCGSTSATPYSSFESPLTLHEFNINQSTLVPSICYFPVPTTPTMAPPAPDTRSLLGGDYLHVATSHDLELEQYDDTDVPLPQSPQTVVFKQESSPEPEPRISGTKRTLRRSIYETRTGGKSVKKEQYANGVSKSRTRRKKPKARPSMKEEGKDEDEFDWDTGFKGPVVFSLQNGRVLSNLDDFIKGPDGKMRHAHQEPGKKFVCKHPWKDDDTTIPDDHPGICGKPFQRTEHRQRHRHTHSDEKPYPCRLCRKDFGRNDNCSAHWFTHVHRPGKKVGRNDKFSLRQVLSVISDPKLMEKLLKAWGKEVKSEYQPEVEEEDNPIFQTTVDEAGKMDMLFTYNAEDAIRKIRSLREAS